MSRSVADNRIVELEDAVIKLENDKLILENQFIRREILLSGNLFTTSSLVNKHTGKEWVSESGVVSDGAESEIKHPALTFDHNIGFISTFTAVPNVELLVNDSTLMEQPSLIARVEIIQDDIRLLRYYEIYPGSPVTVSWTVLSNWTGGLRPPVHESVETDARKLDIPQPRNADLHDAVYLREKHLRLRNVVYTACTDINDNLAREEERYAYPYPAPWLLPGNLCFADSLTDAEGIFILKEAPPLSEQPDHPDADFVYHYDSGLFGQVGWGFTPEDFQGELQSISSWRTAIGVYDNVPNADGEAVKSYLKHHCVQKPERDWRITCNQWGDRSLGINFTEEFICREIDACAKLGIDLYTLDFGWQTGTGGVNTLYPDGSSPMYDHGYYWDVDKKKFPNGLSPIFEYGKSKGVELALWFNPDPTDDNVNASRDAGVLRDLYNEYKTRIFKIDGVWNGSCKAGIRNRDFLESLIRETGGEISFQLDITNGVRWGYFSANHLGVLFVENRYTHFRNYFPYRTHKNLWELSRYLMPQWLQFEFLNNSPETGERYRPLFPADDPFTPDKYPIDYCFAIVMFSNPLAWFEPSKLSDEQVRRLAPVIAKYREIQEELFSGDIYPIGEKPSGRSITGFQSYNPDTSGGFICAYREVTPRDSAVMQLARITGDKALHFELIYGNGSVTREGEGYRFTLPDERSYALFRYTG